MTAVVLLDMFGTVFILVGLNDWLASDSTWIDELRVIIYVSVIANAISVKVAKKSVLILNTPLGSFSWWI